MSGNHLDVLLRVIDLLPNPVYVKDREHRWVEVNSAFCDFLGYPREALLGKSDFDFNPPEQAQVFWDMDNAVFETRGENVNLEPTTNSRGEDLWVESKKSYFAAPDGREFIIGVLTDMTQVKAREDALQAAEQLALQSAEAKTMFLANMSHEIRTPMNGVLGMAQVLRNTQLTETQLTMVDTLERSGEVLLRLIDDILDFSKLDAGQMRVCATPFDLREMVEDISVILGNSARDKQVDLIVKIDPGLPSGLLGDRDRLTQIATNLLGNAIKFTEQGHVCLDIGGTVSGETVALDIKVSDTGIGIAEDKLSRIFEKFQQADNSTTRVYGGTGLGLAISRELAEMMGGTLSATSTPGEGSEFHLNVPLERAEIESSRPTQREYSLLPDMKILAVDDIALNLDVLQAQLRQLGLHTDTVETAEEAVRKLSAAHRAGDPYTLLLTDYQMPRTDGLRLSTALRKRAAFDGLRIIALSSVNDIDVRAAFLALDHADYLVKPVRPGELRRALAETATD